MTSDDCVAFHGVLLAFLRLRPHSPEDLADIFDLLGQLTPSEKREFWQWLSKTAPNIKRWLMAKGAEYRRAA